MSEERTTSYSCDDYPNCPVGQVCDYCQGLATRPAPTGEPVAWCYEKRGHNTRWHWARYPDLVDDGYTETPLYAHPDPRVTELEAKLIEAENTNYALHEQIAALKAAGDGLAERVTHDAFCGRRTQIGPEWVCTCGLAERKAAWEALTNE